LKNLKNKFEIKTDKEEIDEKEEKFVGYKQRLLHLFIIL